MRLFQADTYFDAVLKLPNYCLLTKGLKPNPTPRSKPTAAAPEARMQWALIWAIAQYWANAAEIGYADSARNRTWAVSDSSSGC